MEKNTNAIYDVLIGRYIRMVWTHKIQECQADIYTQKEVKINIIYLLNLQEDLENNVIN